MWCAKPRVSRRVSSHSLHRPELSKFWPFLTPFHVTCNMPVNPGDTFSAGVFSRATVGLRKSCKLFPLSVQAVNRFACAVAPEATWTSLAILDRPTGGEHVDARNADALTVVIPLSQFTHGELKVKTTEGAVTLQVSQGPAVFNAKLHPDSVEPATGRRVVLVLFTLDCTGLPTQDFACLQRLGFRLPQPAQVLKEKPDCLPSCKIWPSLLRFLCWWRYAPDPPSCQQRHWHAVRTHFQWTKPLAALNRTLL